MRAGLAERGGEGEGEGAGVLGTKWVWLKIQQGVRLRRF